MTLCNTNNYHLSVIIVAVAVIVAAVIVRIPPVILIGIVRVPVIIIVIGVVRVPVIINIGIVSIPAIIRVRIIRIPAGVISGIILNPIVMTLIICIFTVSINKATVIMLRWLCIWGVGWGSRSCPSEKVAKECPNSCSC